MLAIRFEMVVCADPETGESFYEGAVRLPAVPRSGEIVRVAVPTGETPLTVDTVAYEPPDRIELWVKGEQYDLGRMREALAALGSTPAQTALAEERDNQEGTR